MSASTVTVLSRDWRVSTSTYLITVIKVRMSWTYQLISRFENVKRMMVSLNVRSADGSANNRRRRTTREVSVTSVNEESYSVQTNVSSECIMYYIRVFVTIYESAFASRRERDVCSETPSWDETPLFISDSDSTDLTFSFVSTIVVNVNIVSFPNFTHANDFTIWSFDLRDWVVSTSTDNDNRQEWRVHTFENEYLYISILRDVGHKV